MTLSNGEGSRRTYILGGACVAVFGAILPLMKPDIAALGLWIFPIAAGSGAVVGAALHATLAWKSHDPAGELLRWILGLTVVGLVAGLLAIGVGAMDVKELPAVVAMGVLAGCGLGLQFQRRMFAGGGFRRRTRREIVYLWSALLGSLGAAGILFAIGWRLSA